MDTDLLEHELKFQLDENKEYLELIKEVLAPIAYIKELGNKSINDIYYDTYNFEFAKNGVSYRTRLVKGSKIIR